jgi:uncharacterized protein YjiS (DUF1127 family)
VTIRKPREKAMTTTAMTVSTPSGALARLTGFVAAVGLGVAGAARAYRTWRDLEALARLDDRMLADIGLTRGDLRDAVAQPLWRDPGALLLTRWRERRTARRTVAPAPHY